MHDFPLLRDLVILVAIAIPVVAVTHRFKIPTVVGFLLTGVAIGPHGLALIGQPESVTELAEIGVVLLLFAIGLELSLSRIIKLGRLVVIGGSLQMVGTIAVIAAVVSLAAVPFNQAVFFGMLAALSSTAIVLKVYNDRGELDTPQGRVVIAILLFQDLCVVPLMIFVPILAGTGSATDQPLAVQVGISLVVTTVLVLAGRVAVPKVLERVAALRNREIFTLCVVFFGLGAAYVTASFGLSLALGAFIAGLVISESEYGVQALSDILPFRDTFSGIFFTSVGMLLDLGYVAHHPALVFAGTGTLVALKTATATVVVKLLRRSLQVSLVSAVALAQVGEFSFVLANVARPLGLFTADTYQLFLGASVISMLATPFIIAGATPVARRLDGWLGGAPLSGARPSEQEMVKELLDHVIIVGYGLNGRNLARVLKSAEIPYVILEQNGQVVRQARLNREPILFGDATRAEVLEKVGIQRARAIVFAISAPAEERLGVAVARHQNPKIWIIVRTRYLKEMEELTSLGADQVVPEEFETSLEIFSRVLRLYGVPSNAIRREVDTVRSEHYGMLRGQSLPTLKLDALRHLGVQVGMESIEVEAGSRAIGENPVTLRLRRSTGASVVASVRGTRVFYEADREFRFEVGDVVVLVGRAEALEAGSAMFQVAAEGRRASRVSGTLRLSDMVGGPGEA